MKNKTTEEFIEQAKAIHGDRYDYSKVDYINNHTNVIIICPIHGEFKQLPTNHLKGEGCYECGKIRTSDSKKVSIEESIRKAKIIHGNFYDYSKVTYNKVADKVAIICPIHGKFEQTMNNHLAGQGCPKCAKEKRDSWKREDLEKAIKSSNTIKDCLLKLGKDTRTSNRNKFKEKVIEYNLDISHFTHQIYEPKEGYLICSSCKKEKPLSKFYINNSKSRGYSYKCKECSKKYNKTRIEKAKELKLEYLSLLGNKCSNCGLEVNEHNYVAFDFHHINPDEKEDNINNMNKEEALQELNKCTILCANCHRIFHHKLKLKEYE